MQNRILFHLKKIKEEGNSDICDNMDDLKDVILSEISQTEKDRCCMIYILVESKRVKSQKQKAEWWLSQTWEWRK